ncbi:MAG: sensor histidine kinase [Lachnospiraceae bacterium]|nr:sensor histidine kinase [Lachnospiraceae bacterium]
MEFLSKFSYAIEILTAELVFLYGFQRRSFFPLRFVSACLVTMALCAASFAGNHVSPWLRFLEFVLIIGLSIAGMNFSFSAPANAILSACISGVALQHIAHHIQRMILLFWQTDLPRLEVELGVHLITCLLAWLTLGRALTKRDRFRDSDSKMVALAIVIVLICTGITRLMRMGGSSNVYMTICTSAYAITCCVLTMVIQFSLQRESKLRNENRILTQLNEEARKRYETSRANAESMNIKYHDLKHKLVSLEGRLPERELSSMRELIDRYDNFYYTGLEVLDIVLNEKNLQCQSKGIRLTAMGDGKELSFMDTMDVYSLFGNLLDNAIEAVICLEPPERRSISLVIERRGISVNISCVNFTDNTLTLREDGLPETTKTTEEGFHGYGMLSILRIAQKYHGGVQIEQEDGIFTLNIYMSEEN